MSLSTTLGLVHAAAALLGVLSFAHVLRAGRAAALVGQRWLLLTLAAVATWSAHLAWWYLLGASDAQLLWLPAVGVAMGGLLAWSVAVLRPERAGSRLWTFVWLVDPVVLVAAQLLLGSSAVVTRTDDTIEYGWLWGVHVLIVFAMMLATASLWVTSRADPSRTLRLLSHVVVAGLLAAGVAQGLRLMVLDLVVAATGAIVAVVVVRADPGDLRPRPRSGALLDGLGALVLVFDRDDALVHLNAPARAFFARRDGAPPAAGTPVAELLPVRVGEALAGVELRLGDAGGAVDFVCFAARLGAATSPPHGSVVVLRPASGPEALDTPDGPRLAAHVALRIEQLVAGVDGSDPLVVLGLTFRRPEDAQRAAQAIEFVVGSLDTLVVDLAGPCSLVAVAPVHVEPYLLDVAAGWRPRSGDAEPGEGAVRSVSLSPVLAGERIVRHGPAREASELVAEVRRELGH